MLIRLITIPVIGIAVVMTRPIAAQESGAADAAQRVRDVVADSGLEQATALLRALHDNQPQVADSAVGLIVNLAVEAFQGGERRVAIDLLEATTRVFPGNIAVYAVLGQLYWYTNDRPRCIATFAALLEIDPNHVMAHRFWDLLFFVPEGFVVPSILRTEHVRARPLRAADAELDYRAVMENRELLRGVFGPDDDWPKAELTLDENRRALANHEREHEQRSAFTYTVTNHAESEVLGCIYILPIHVEEYDAQIIFWVTQSAVDQGFDDELYAAIRDWLRQDWPFERVVFPGRDMDWKTYDALVEGH
jgi:tetratricopeptide (TPR) repeat protein